MSQNPDCLVPNDNIFSNSPLFGNEEGESKGSLLANVTKLLFEKASHASETVDISLNLYDILPDQVRDMSTIIPEQTGKKKKKVKKEVKVDDSDSIKMNDDDFGRGVESIVSNLRTIKLNKPDEIATQIETYAAKR